VVLNADVVKGMIASSERSAHLHKENLSRFMDPDSAVPAAFDQRT
jgi:hypothetical protein